MKRPADTRRAAQECMRGSADWQRKMGKLPDSRAIEKRWSEVARRNERTANDARKPLATEDDS